ncbi:MAG: UdgX family uracil-DNA binding protein [Burkholderiaceae bacterium]|nr:UdgX family uracil-DNA binding protein [Burkholderiaceae bacterium]
MPARGHDTASPAAPDRPSKAAGARHLASGAAREALAALRGALQRCRECPLGYFATQGVAGEGTLRPALMLVGEVPGDQEDLQGHPFVGPAGQLLFRAIDSLGWPREALYVTNAVKHFKFELRGKRRIHKTPSQREAAACLHWLEDEIGLVEPRAAIALGATAARSLLHRNVAVTRERGRWLQRDDGLRVLVVLHPSALLRIRGEEREPAYRQWLGDLRHAEEIVDEWLRRSRSAAGGGESHS